LTLPPEASAARGSDPAAAPTPTPDDSDPARDRLIRPAVEIFDSAAVRAEMLAAMDLAAPEARDQRAAVVAVLSRAKDHGSAAIAAAFMARPTRARPTVRAYAWLTDRLVTEALHAATTRIHPLPNPTSAEKLSLLAVGGYGRAEMAPFSDVDLLFLTPWKTTPWAESVVETMLYVLWDLHLKVGNATRTVKDCLRLAGEDYTIRTALLENRWLAGDESLAEELRTKLRTQLFRKTAPEFIEAKLAERAERHTKQGGQRYVVEPNVKEGKGGLRDLQSLFWIDKYLHGVEDLSVLVKRGVFTAEEYAAFREAEEFLLAVRCHLHLISGRAQDQLTFDLQVAVAERMGYADHGGRRGVEHFMQAYFRHATTVGDMTRILLSDLEESHVHTAPTFTALFRRAKKLRPPYKLTNNRLTVTSEKKFLADKLNMLGIFEEALRTGYLIHPDAMRLVRRNLHLIDDQMREDRDAGATFLDLLLKHGNPERALRRMNELGVLGAFLPEFAPIVAMMQFNMYHAYTVDEHIIQCVSCLSQIERGELVEELPVASGILKTGINRKVLYLAVLLHDIGKGRTEDHSVLGAQLARKVAPRLGLKPDEAETVEWLVRHHLLMSDMAQKRDLSDPRTVRDFAKAVKTRKRLDLLTVLTVCDIRGVGPNTWNNWKAVLLRNLYRATEMALEGGLESVNREARSNEAKRDLRETLTAAGWDRKAIRTETARHYDPYWQGLPASVHVVFARLLREVTDDEVGIDILLDADRDATRACFALVDHPGIFSRLAGALALVGANVVDARTYTSKDGYATAAFWVQDAAGRPYEERRLPRLTEMIRKSLKGEVVARDVLKSRDPIKKRERVFKVPTSIVFDNEGSDIYTIIEVDTRDRLGLVYDLSRTLAANNVYIASALIATYGEQAVDTFYVKDMFGLKFHSEPRRKALEKKLREAIAGGSVPPAARSSG
jgi:[protein-PII] uridylyltransferase